MPQGIASQQQNANRPDYRIKAHIEQLPAMKICQDVYAGTLRLRDLTTEYLPKYPKESKANYQRRVMQSVAIPALKRAITLALGLAFDKEPTTKDIDKQLEEELKNVDQAGKTVGLFARAALLLALRDGHSFIYVDMPPAPRQSETRALEPTRYDAQKPGRRPYAVLYQKAQAINWRFEYIDGVPVLQRITFREVHCEPDGLYGEKNVEKYRVLTPGWVRVWRINENGEAVLDGEEIPTSLDYIPVYPVYGGEEIEPFVSEPPLLELAIMNVQHYQMTSDLHNILHVANVPILWARNRDKKAPFQEVGPSILIDLDGEHSALGYAEHAGNAIGKAQEEIKQIGTRMTVAGFQLLADKTSGPETATGEIKDAAESDSELSVAVKSLTNALNNMLQAWGDYRGQKITGSIELNVEYERLVLSVQEMTELRNLANDHHLSTESLLELLKRAGKLGPEFDITKELKKLFGAAWDKPQIERAAMEDTTRNESPIGDGDTDEQ